MSELYQRTDGLSKASPLDRNVRLLVWMQGLRMMLIVMPLFGPFFLANGLPQGDLLLLQGSSAFGRVLSEVPTGYLADCWSRQRCLVLADTLYALSMLCFIFGHSFTPFLIAELLMGFSLGLVSGADTALLYDSLKAQGRAEAYQQLESTGVFRGRIGEALGSLLASGFLFLGVPRWAFIVSAGRSMLLLGMSLALVETPHEKTVTISHLARFRAAWRATFVEHAAVRWIVFVAATFVAVSVASVWLTQVLFLERLPGHQGWLPILFLASNLTGAGLTALLSTRVDQNHVCTFLMSVICFVALGHLCMGTLAGAWVLLGTVLFQLNWACTPLVRREIHDHMPSAHRATAISWFNLVTRLIQASLMVVAALIVNWQGAGAGFLCTAALLVVTVAVGALTRPGGCPRSNRVV